MRKCLRCEVVKDEDLFERDSRKKQGITAQCRECANKIRKKYLDTRREKVREINKKFYYSKHEKNRQKRTENSRKYRENNLDKSREYQRNYYLENAEKMRLQALENSKKPSHKETRNKRLRENKKESDLPKIRARKILQAAVRVGYIKRPDKCSKCLKKCKPHGHHEDYNKPLEIRWLCKVCHNHVHGKLLDLEP